MYWFIALFDSNTENIIKKMENEVRRNLIASHLVKQKDGRPHLTLGHYYELDKEEYIRLIESFYEPIESFTITFNTIGTFINYPTLFLSPTITKDLIHFHLNHHQFFKKFNYKANPLYLPEQWIPHCTILNKLTQETLIEEFTYCLKKSQTIMASIEEVALVEMVEDDKGNVETTIVFSKKLRKSQRNHD